MGDIATEIHNINPQPGSVLLIYYPAALPHAEVQHMVGQLRELSRKPPLDDVCWIVIPDDRSLQALDADEMAEFGWVRK